MHEADWRYYLYRASDALKRPLGAYCVQLYREAIGEHEYLIALKKQYKYLNSGKLNGETLDEMLDEADTRAWFKLLRQQLNGRLSHFVPKRSRNTAGQHIAFLIREFNEAYHQQAFDHARAQAAIAAALAFARLINTERAEAGIRADFARAISALEALADELAKAGEDGADGGADGPATHALAVAPPTLPVGRLGRPAPFGITPLLDPDEQHTVPLTPTSLYTLEAITPDGRTLERALTEMELIIGRSAQADIQLDDPQVSRLHLRLTLTGQLTLTDLGSTGGTLLNGARLPSHQPTPWRVGQPILVGNTRVILKWTV